MAFKMSVQKYSGKISEVEIGKGEKAIKIGGESTLPFYSFDGNIGNTRKSRSRNVRRLSRGMD